MTDKLSGLNPEFLAKVNKLLANCLSKHDLTMVPIQGLRTIEEQAALWRQGRSLDMVKAQMERMKDHDAPYLASVLDKAGPQTAPGIVTKAIPGYSWHNWGCALDCYVSIDGRLIYRVTDPLMATKGNKAYKAYADEATALGLKAGYYFKGGFQDRPHVQLFSQEVPEKYTLKMVNDHFAALKT